MTTPPDPQGQPDRSAAQQPDEGREQRGSEQRGGDEQAGQQPQQGRAQYGQQPSYGQPQYGEQPPYGQAPYGQPSYGQPQYGEQPSYGQSPPYARQPGYGQEYGEQQYGQYPYGAGSQYPYPYGAAGPAGVGEADLGPVQRPQAMLASLVLLVISALPFLAIGAGLLLLPINLAGLPPELNIDQAMADAGVTAQQLVSAFRVVGGIVFALAVLYVAFAVLAFLGRNWARIVVTVMTVVFGLFLLFMVASVLVGGGIDIASLLILLVIFVASVAGTILMFVAPSSQFFAAARR